MYKLTAFAGTTIFATDKACKCMICEHISGEHQHLTFVHGSAQDFTVHIRNIKNMVQTELSIMNNRGTTLKWQKYSFPYVCQLCWYGIVQNYQDYIWDGVNLLVFNQTRQEFVVPSGDEYFPVGTSRIKFKLDETTKKWVAMPR